MANIISKFWTWATGAGGGARVAGIQSDRPPRDPDELADETVTFDTAMGVSTWWACVSLLADVLSTVPFRCYQTVGINASGERALEVDTSNALWRLFRYSPNSYSDCVSFWKTFLLNFAVNGNAYVRVARAAGRPVSVECLMSGQMRVELLSTGRKQFLYRDLNGVERIYSDTEIWHCKGFGNGVTGLSPLEYGATSLAIAQKTTKRQAAIAREGGKFSGILSKKDGAFSKPEDRELAREMIQDIAADKAGGIHVLEFDTQLQQLGMTPQDMQLLESRSLSVPEIARIMRTPSVLVNDSQSGTTVWGTGIGELWRSYYSLNLFPLGRTIAESFMRFFLTADERGSIEFAFDFDTLLEPTRAELIDMNAKAISTGQMIPNEARDSLRLPRVDDGDTLLFNANLLPIDERGRDNGATRDDG